MLILGVIPARAAFRKPQRDEKRSSCRIVSAVSGDRITFMCNLYSITTSQAAIIALFRVMNRYVGNLPPMPRVFHDG